MPPAPPPTCDEALFATDDAPNQCKCPAGQKFAPETATVSKCCVPLVPKECGAATVCCVSPSPSPPPMPPPMPPPALPTCVEGDPANQCKCKAGFVQNEKWDVSCCAETVGLTCPNPGESSCCEEKFKSPPPMPPPSPKPSFPPPCLPAPELWECISNCHYIDNDQKTTCKDKCTPCSPLSPSAPPQCKDEDPPFCEDELKTDDDKLENCKAQQFKTKCSKTCGYCPSDVATLASALTGSPEADGSGSTMALIGGGVAAVALLALLFLASRRSTRAYISSVVGKAYGSAASVKSMVAVAAPASERACCSTTRSVSARACPGTAPPVRSCLLRLGRKMPPRRRRGHLRVRHGHAVHHES